MDIIPTKSKYAFECSTAKLTPNRKGHIYFWTFTFAERIDVDIARKRWSSFLKYFGRWNKRRGKIFQGLRVFELHPGGHGLHVHVVTTNYAWINDVRRLWVQAGGGRVNAKPIPFERRNYLGKYLSKSGRSACLKGVRLWAPFGGFQHTRVSDIEVESDFTRTYALLVATVGRFDKLPWYIRKAAVSNLQRGRPWNYGFHITTKSQSDSQLLMTRAA